MTSKQLEDAQNIIETLLCVEIKEPMKNWTLIKHYEAILKDIDSKRRKLWNSEKFGDYDKIADDVYDLDNDRTFTSDDIPF